MHTCKHCWQAKPATPENFSRVTARFCNECIRNGLVSVQPAPPRPKKVPTCHPNRPYKASGLCVPCYNNSWHQRNGRYKPANHQPEIKEADY